MKNRIGRSLAYGFLVAAVATILGGATPSQANGITIVSNGATLAARSTKAEAKAGDYFGRHFRPAEVCSCGTNTQPPVNSPTFPSTTPTEVINIPPGDGESGFFKVTFTLPRGFANAILTVSANIDDAGHAYLNDNKFGHFNEYDSLTFSQNSGFVVGKNVLILSDINTGGPSGAAFWVSISYSDSKKAP